MMPAASLASIPRVSSTDAVASPESWNLSWTDKLKGKRSAVFDCTETEGGAGVWRASVWKKQNAEILKAEPSGLVPVIVLRHEAVILAMQQSFWDRYKIGKLKKVTDAMTGKPTSRNPVLSGSDANLVNQMGSGAVVLACHLALQDLVGTVAKHDKVGEEEAEKRAIAGLVPGVILQPSGVFAALHAQGFGASYVKAS